MSLAEIAVFATADEVAAEAARRVVALASGELAARSEWHVAVSGGSVATSVMPAIVAAGERAGLDWSRLHVWFADERFLDRGDRERNATPIAAALRGAMGFAPEHLHAVLARDECASLDEAAAAYGRELRRLVPPAVGDGVRPGAGGAGDLAGAGDAGAGELPALDLVLLGAGPDGHTASLFPGPEHADERAATGETVAVRDSPKPPPDRVSLTFPCLAAAARVWAIVTGEGKADAVRAAASAAPSADECPIGAALDRPDALLLLDEPAASRLEGEVRAR